MPVDAASPILGINGLAERRTSHMSAISLFSRFFCAHADCHMQVVPRLAMQQPSYGKNKNGGVSVENSSKLSLLPIGGLLGAGSKLLFIKFKLPLQLRGLS